MKPGAVLLRLLLILIGTLLLISCGKKTAPIPPGMVIPAPITGVEYQLDENGATLFWKKPLRTDQGKKLGRIDSFIIERAEYPSNEFCRECPVHYLNVASISATDRSEEQRSISSYRDEDLRAGHIYLYRVLTRMGWQVTSLPSKPISFSWQLPLAAITGLQADSGDQQIDLHWQPPTEGLDGATITEPLQYQVFRSVSGERFLVLDNPVTDPYFKDDHLANGIDYRYKVRASRLSGGTGALSDPVKAVPRDLTPPPAPQNLNTVTTPAGTRIFWEPVVTPDLAGYRIFRRSEDKGPELITTVGASRSSFVDPVSGEQKTYYYKIKAFDRAEPANESPFSEETRTGH